MRQPTARLAKIGTLIGGLVCLLGLGVSSHHTVPADQIGVIWYRFSGGTYLDSYLPPGRHMIAPWNVVYHYQILPQKRATTCPSLSQEGDPFLIAYTLNFQLIPAQVPHLHQTVGPNYVENTVIPTLDSSLRNVAGKSTAADLQHLAKDPMWLKSISDQNAAQFEAWGIKIISLEP